MCCGADVMPLCAWRSRGAAGAGELEPLLTSTLLNEKTGPCSSGVTCLDYMDGASPDWSTGSSLLYV